MTRRVPAVLAAVGLAVLPACGGADASSGASAAGTPTPGAVVVAMRGLEFVPSDVSVRAGQTVRWVNESDMRHDAVAESGAEFRSPLFGRGESYEARLEQPGIVRYVCTIHPGMEGTIRVSG